MSLGKDCWQIFMTSRTKNPVMFQKQFGAWGRVYESSPASLSEIQDLTCFRYTHALQEG